MTDDYDLTMNIDKEALEWILDNLDNIERVTPRLIMKIMDIKNAEPDRWKEMANIKFGI